MRFFIQFGNCNFAFVGTVLPESATMQDITQCDFLLIRMRAHTCPLYGTPITISVTQ
jgi:hypothetical protein